MLYYMFENKYLINKRITKKIRKSELSVIALQSDWQTMF